MFTMICYPKCSTCQKAMRWLDEHDIEYEIRDIKEENPSAEELTCWIQKSGRSVQRFFNTSGMLYRSMNLKDKLKEMTDDEKIALLATDGMLVKRPILLAQEHVFVGFRQEEYQCLLTDGGGK